MAIRTVITRGYGNGTFNGTIALVVTKGYAISTAIAEVSLSILKSIRGSITKSILEADI